LQPYTDKTLEELAKSGVRNVQVLCPGFAVDCLETLEEIAMQNRELFEEAGGDRLEYIPALNDSDAHAALMQTLFEEALASESGEAPGRI
jgi:ferrochelatase